MVKAITHDSYTTELSSGKHLILADEPLSLGGKDTGMEPGQLLCASLASCTNITLRMYINRKEWEVTSIETSVDFKENESGEKALIRQIKFNGSLDEKQLTRLMNIADKCPVHKMLEKGMDIQTEMV